MVPTSQQGPFRNVREKCKSSTELVKELMILVAEDAAAAQASSTSLAAVGGSENFYRWAVFQNLACICVNFPCSVFEAELSNEIPVIKASLAGTRLVGRLSVGMSKYRTLDVA